MRREIFVILFTVNLLHLRAENWCAQDPGSKIVVSMSKDSVLFRVTTGYYSHGITRDTIFQRNFAIIDSIEWKEDPRRKTFLLKCPSLTFCQVWPLYRMEDARIRTTYQVVFRNKEKEGYTFLDAASFRHAYAVDSVSIYAADRIGIGQATIFYPEKLYNTFSSLPTFRIADFNAYLSLYDSLISYELNNKSRFSKWYGGMQDDICLEYFISRGCDPYRSLAYLRTRDENFSTYDEKAGQAKMKFGMTTLSVLDSYFPWQDH